jgi:hypothetical protein
MQGTIPAQGANPGIPSAPGPWNLGKDQFPRQECRSGATPFTTNGTPGKAQDLCPWDRYGETLHKVPSNAMHAQPSTSYYGNQPMMSPQMQNQYTGQGHGFYQNPSQQPNFSWQPGASQTPGPFFHGYQQQPKLPFLATLHFPDLTRLLNDPICHDPRWPPMPTKFPSDIPKFEAKPNEDPGDHVTTFHLWCSSNSLKDDSVQL